MKTRLAVLVGALVVVVFVRVWMKRSRPDGTRATPGNAAAPPTDDEERTADEPAHGAAEYEPARTGEPARTPGPHPTLDRAAADRMRDKLRAFFAEAGIPWGTTPELATADAAGAKYPTIPTLPPEDGGAEGRIDPKYIQERVRDDLFPLAKDCYTQALARTPHLAGRVELAFTIMGDPSVGGVVGEASLGKGTTIADAEMQTCVRESLMSTTFAAPPGGHEITVVYPIDFSDDDDD